MSRRSAVARPPRQHVGKQHSAAKGRVRPSPLAAASAGRAGTKGDGRVAGLLDAVQQEVLTVSFWLDGERIGERAPTVIRVRGRRLEVAGKRQPGDVFVRDEVVSDLPPGSGPFSITVQVRNVNPGKWEATAEVIPSTGARSPRGVAAKGRRLAPASWSWRRWSLGDAPEAPVETGLGAFARRPGIGRGVWAGMTVGGIVLALVLQGVLVAGEDLSIGRSLVLSALAVVTGAIGAKAWFIFLDRHRGGGQWNGWCIQGLVLAVVATIAFGAPIFDLPLGTFLDITTPALFLGMALGRIGCFFAGCCGGRPTCSRWGVWSSDQRIGVRRIPTQLLESLLSFTVAAASAVFVIVSEPSRGGVLFVGAVAAYTLCRQLLLRFRGERRRTSIGSRAVALASAVALLATGLVAFG